MLSEPHSSLAQAFAGPRSYLPMASHAYALSGNPLTMDDFHRRYLLLNQYLADPHPLTQLKPDGVLYTGHAESLSTLSLPLRPLGTAIHVHA